MLKLQERGKPDHGMWLVKSYSTVGRAANCDFVLPSNKVADVHIELLTDKDNVILNDCSRGHSLFVNEMPVGQYGPLQHGDVIRLADTELEIVDPNKGAVVQALPQIKPHNKKPRKQTDNVWRLDAVGDWLTGQSFLIRSNTLLGRSSSCDITIPGTHLSRRHAQLTVTNKGLLIEDLGSSNGTYVNDKKVKKALLKPGDEVRFDVLTFRVAGPQLPSDVNKTVMRSALPASRAETVISKAGQSTSAKKTEQTQQTEKQWKAKPTSVGNRDPHVDNYAKPKPNWFLYSFIVVALGSAGLIYFMLS